MLTFNSSSSNRPENHGTPHHMDRNGQVVVVLRQLDANEADYAEVGPMYECRFTDGVSVHAFVDELLPKPYDQMSAAEQEAICKQLPGLAEWMAKDAIDQ